MTSALEDLEGRFYRYLEASQQTDPEWNRSVLEYYAPMFDHCTQVLDVGCGEGQFLQLLQTRGVRGVGVDCDSWMIERCNEQGLEVVQDDAFHYLPRHKAAFDGIFCSNLLEHLCSADAVRFLALCLEALRPGGLIVLTTPNTASVVVQLHEFWRDATHVRPYSRSLVEFLLDSVGFDAVRSGVNPATSWSPPAEMQNLPLVLDHLRLSIRANEDELASALEAPVDAPSGFPKGLIVRLRRALARLMVQRVLFEEFDAMRLGLTALGKNVTVTAAAVQQIGQSLYHTYLELLAAPREVWVSGTRPTDLTQEAR